MGTQQALVLAAKSSRFDSGRLEVLTSKRGTEILFEFVYFQRWRKEALFFRHLATSGHLFIVAQKCA